MKGLRSICSLAALLLLCAGGESFSVTNTAQFNNPTGDVSNSNYGYITGAGGARGLQLGFKVSF